eukprot:g2708.t1
MRRVLRGVEYYQDMVGQDADVMTFSPKIEEEEEEEDDEEISRWLRRTRRNRGRRHHRMETSEEDKDFEERKMSESKVNMQNLETKLRNLEMRDISRSNMYRTTPLGTPETQSSRRTEESRFTPTTEYLSQIRETDNIEVKRLRQELSAEKKIMVTLQRLNSRDFYRPERARVVEKMMEELNTYPPSLRSLFSVKDVVREVMEFEPSPEVKLAAGRSGYLRRRRFQSDSGQKLRHSLSPFVAASKPVKEQK